MKELRQVDLNLLLSLKVLLESRSVSQAAMALHISQPAMSRHLAKLRDVVSDPLLVRAGEGYILTEKARVIQGQLQRVFPEIRKIFRAGPEVDDIPKRFKVACPDFTMKYVMSDIIADYMAKDSGITFEVSDWGDATARTRLIKGDIHFALSIDESFPPSMIRRPISSDTTLILGRAGHPALSGERTSVEEMLKFPFIDAVTGGGGGWQVCVDRELSALKLHRNVRVIVPFYEEAFTMVARSDLLVLVPRHVAVNSQAAKGLFWKNVPLDMPKLQFCLWWHRVFQDDPSHRWLRKNIFPKILTHSALLNTEMPDS